MGVSSIKLYDANPKVLSLLNGTDIEVVVGTYPNDITTQWASDPSSADTWLEENVVPWLDSVKITTIAVANELIDTVTSDESKWVHVVPGMWALWSALKNRSLENQIKVVSPQHPGFICHGKPPSAGQELPYLTDPFKDLLYFVSTTGSFLYVTIFPWYPYIRINGTCPDIPEVVSKDFVFFEGNDGYYDNRTGHYYQNQFDAQLDTVLAVAERLGFPDVDVKIAETGWATGGHEVGTVENAQEWMHGLLGKLCSGQGTPRRPGKFIPFWLFEAFDEPWKTNNVSPWEPYWGINYVNGTLKYDLDLRRADQYPAPTTDTPTRYCLPRRKASVPQVKSEIDFICGEGGLDCEKATQGCPSRFHWAVIYNAYFQEHYQAPLYCDLSGTGRIFNKLPNRLARHPECKVLGKPQ